jgi:putative N6-adenine-specific DNA methylase
LNLVAKTFNGLEPVLAKELEELGAWNINILKRAVSFDSNKELLYKSNFCLRTALRILQPICTFRARNENELYKKVMEFDWSAFMNNDQTFAIDAVVYSDFFTHSQYVALKTKDAIVDQFREKTGRRPSISLENPNLLINVHVSQDRFTLSLDSSCEPLNRRGYRTGEHKAPINESLAAGLLLLAGWNKNIPLIDPMCGSGTILLEAAMIAGNIPPGIKRDNYGFMRWNNFDAELWKKVKDETLAKIEQPRVKIMGSDIDMKSVDIARQSALDFNLKSYITFTCRPFEDLTPDSKVGMVITNPPYGERIRPDDIINLYKTIGNTLKKNFQGFDAWIISSNFQALKHIGLKPSAKHLLFNGALECKYERFSLYEGSMKVRPLGDGSEQVPRARRRILPTNENETKE